MTRYWAVFLFNADGTERWNSLEHFKQSDTFYADQWKAYDVWEARGGGAPGTYVYVELNEEDI